MRGYQLHPTTIGVMLREHKEQEFLILDLTPFLKNIGKPYAGKPHVRFDEGGLARACLLLYLDGPLMRGYQLHPTTIEVMLHEH